jgi:hypothetical protein
MEDILNDFLWSCVLEPGVGIEPTSVIRLLDVYCGSLRADLLSAARRLNRSAFGGEA